MPPKPLAGRKHSIQYGLRLTPAESDTLVDAAAEMGLTPTGLLRLLVRNAPFLVVSLVPRTPD